MLRILLWLFEIGLLILAMGIAAVSLFAFKKSLSSMLRAAATLLIAVALSAMTGIGFGLLGLVQGGDPVSQGLLAMIVSLPLSVWSLDRMGRKRAAKSGTLRGARGGRMIEPPADERVAAAWRGAVRLAPAQRQRIARAREACAYVLHWAETHPFDMEAVECAVLIRKRLPELIDQTGQYCALSAAAERQTVIANMVADLESLGGMALRRVEDSKARLGDTLAATRAHIASRTDETPAF